MLPTGIRPLNGYRSFSDHLKSVFFHFGPPPRRNLKSPEKNMTKPAEEKETSLCLNGSSLELLAGCLARKSRRSGLGFGRRFLDLGLLEMCLLRVSFQFLRSVIFRGFSKKTHPCGSSPILTHRHTHTHTLRLWGKPLRFWLPDCVGMCVLC